MVGADKRSDDRPNEAKNSLKLVLPLYNDKQMTSHKLTTHFTSRSAIGLEKDLLELFRVHFCSKTCRNRNNNAYNLVLASSLSPSLGSVLDDMCK